ncbi:uncharacterized protein LOC119565987 isoform X4 [Chelonia mydas]|uniref:uncharacterized protein LOC119566066 isoform X4 n=2 Tax=Chelonia mydas TaxID=8469 RepID=UPI001CA87E21|nr:uncharacterized protein LOC119566066 isoform X4 [Chelonia mydas]XP_043401663.1 uncharacterized protein LOC119565987 isoform X4 [Chelonia mydas]
MGARCPRAGRMRRVSGVGGWDPGVREPAGCGGCPGGWIGPKVWDEGCPGPPPCRVCVRRQELSLSPPPLTGAPMAGELRCQCVQTVSAVISPKRIALVELIPEGPHCGVPEVIATTKQGKKICLEPSAPWVKLIVTKILSRYLPWGCGSSCWASPSAPCPGSGERGRQTQAEAGLRVAGTRGEMGH